MFQCLHWCNIACIGNLILSIKSVTPIVINVSMFPTGSLHRATGRPDTRVGTRGLRRALPGTNLLPGRNQAQALSGKLYKLLTIRLGPRLDWNFGAPYSSTVIPFP